MFAEYLRSHWADVRSKLLELIGRLDDADLDYRPYDSAWTVRQLVLHIAHEEYGEVQHGITHELAEWPEIYPAADYRTVASILAKLEEVHAHTLKLLAAVDDAALANEVELPWGAKGTLLSVLGHVIEHETHHRAELSLILGMLGKQGLDA